MSLLDSMPHTVDIKVQKRTRGPLGGQTRVWNVVSDNVVCFVQTASQAEIALFEKQGVKITHKVYFDPAANVTEKNMLFFGTQLLEVVSFADAGVNQIGLIKVICMEMTSDVDGEVN